MSVVKRETQLEFKVKRILLPQLVDLHKVNLSAPTMTGWTKQFRNKSPRIQTYYKKIMEKNLQEKINNNKGHRMRMNQSLCRTFSCFKILLEMEILLQIRRTKRLRMKRERVVKIQMNNLQKRHNLLSLSLNFKGTRDRQHSLDVFQRK